MSDNQHITTLALEELKTFLWGAAVRLRGQIDAAGYKEYIFPLLFFKRISDVYDEQFNAFVQEGGEEYAREQAQDLAIRIPDGAHWNDVRQVTENVGRRLVEAFIAIEQANPAVESDGRRIGGLEGIFGPKDGWTNKAKMPDHIITSLIEDFSKHNLSLAACPADEMGQAYEYLVGKFADDAGNTAQEFYTNRTVVTLMAEILNPRPNESIYDPTCGSGGMLIKCLTYLKDKGEEWQGVHVFGQEINGLTSSIARMNLYLNGIEDFSIVCADTLAHPAFLDGSRLRQFDIVLANPPYSIKQWDRDAFAHDKWGRNFLGTPTQARADYAFIQHILASMDNKTGRSAILLPHGVLNRDEDKEIRINHVKTDCIDAIIGLGRNLFYNSGLESFILICSNNKPESKKGRILFIDAEKFTHKQGKQAYLFSDDIAHIMEAYNNENDIPGLSKYVSIKEILQNGGNLNIKSYVKAISDNQIENSTILLSDFNDSRKRVQIALSKLSFVEEPYHTQDIETTVLNEFNRDLWEKVTLGDVASEYSIRIDDPSKSKYDYFIGSDCISQYDFRIKKRASTQNITSAQKLFQSGDYLLVRRSLYGSDFRERAPRADFDGVCSADILTIRENHQKIVDGFLIFVLYNKQLWDFIVSNSSGGLTRRIKWKQLSSFEFYLPPKEIQQKISDKLWAAYELKEAYKKMIAATDEMVKAQFIEMFEGQNYATKPLAQLISKSFPGEWGLEDKTGNGIKVIRTTNITNDGTLDLTETVTRNISDTKLQKKLLKKGDILLERSGGTKDNPVGRVAYFNENDAYVANNFTQTLRSIGDIESYYLFHFLFYYYKMNKMKIRSMGNQTTGIQNLNMDDYMQIAIPVPPREHQEIFISIAKQAEKSKSELRRAIEKIDRVMKSLMQ